jgi:hypothetical protein
MAYRATRQIAVVASAALLLGGCGGSALTFSPTSTTVALTPAPAKSKAKHPPHHAGKRGQPAKQSTTPAGPSTSTSNANASTYPSTFSSGFITKCISRGGSQARCVCTATSIEQAVSFTTFKAALQNLVSGQPPGWYTAAQRQCHGF